MAISKTNQALHLSVCLAITDLLKDASVKHSPEWHIFNRLEKETIKALDNLKPELSHKDCDMAKYLSKLVNAEINFMYYGDKK